MKRFRIVVLTAVILLSFACSAAPVLAAEYYEEPASGVRFEIPDGWNQQEVEPEADMAMCMFAKGLHFIGYGYGDIMDFIPAAASRILSREDINHTYISESDIQGMYGTGTVTTEVYGGVEYYVWKGDYIQQYLGTDVTLDSIIVIHIENAYMYQFQCQAVSLEDEYVDEFMQMLETVEYPESAAVSVIAYETKAPAASLPAAAQETYAVPAESFSYTPSSYASPSYNPALPTAGGIILSLILTVAIYSLPIIIYRYGIRKRPMERRAAKRLTIIYGIAAFFVMTLIVTALGGTASVGGAIFLWSFVNYSMLTRGADTSAAGDSNRVSGTYTVAGQPGATSSGWYPTGGSVNPYAYAPQPQNGEPGSSTPAANPYAAPQPDNSAPSQGAWPVTRSDMKQQKAGQNVYTPPSDNRAPGLDGGQRAQGSANPAPPQPQQAPPVSQDKDKYDRGESRKSKREESERRRGHEPHKYWRGE